MQLNPFRHHASRTGMAVFDGANLFVYENGFVREHIPQQQAPRQPIDRPMHDPYAQTITPQLGQQPVQMAIHAQPTQQAVVVQQQTYVTPQGQPCDANGVLLSNTPEPVVVAKTSGHSLSAFFEEDEDVFVQPTAVATEQLAPVSVDVAPVANNIDLTRFNDSELDDSELEMMMAIAAEETYNEEISMNAEDHIDGLRAHRIEAAKVVEHATIVKPTATASVTVETHKEPEPLMQWADDEDDDDAYSTECIIKKSAITDAEDDIYHGGNDGSSVDIINAAPVVEAAVGTLFIEVDDEDLDVSETTAQADLNDQQHIEATMPNDEDQAIAVVKKLSDHFNGVIPDDIRIDPVVNVKAEANEAVAFSLADDDDEVTPAESMNISSVLEEINTDAPIPPVKLDTSSELEVSLAKNCIIATGTNAFNITAALKTLEYSDQGSNSYSLIKYETVSDLIIPKDVITPLYDVDGIMEVVTGEVSSSISDLVLSRILGYIEKAKKNSDEPLDAEPLELLKQWINGPIWHKDHYRAIFNLACIGSNETKFDVDDDNWIITPTAPRSVIVIDSLQLADNISMVDMVDAAIEDLTNHYGSIAEEFGCARDQNGVLSDTLSSEDDDSYMPCVAGYLTAAHGHKVIIRDSRERISMYTYYKWNGKETGSLELEYTF